MFRNVLKQISETYNSQLLLDSPLRKFYVKIEKKSSIELSLNILCLKGNTHTQIVDALGAVYAESLPYTAFVQLNLIVAEPAWATMNIQYV